MDSLKDHHGTPNVCACEATRGVVRTVWRARFGEDDRRLASPFLESTQRTAFAQLHPVSTAATFAHANAERGPATRCAISSTCAHQSSPLCREKFWYTSSYLRQIKNGAGQISSARVRRVQEVKPKQGCVEVPRSDLTSSASAFS